MVYTDLNKKQDSISNSDVDWGKHYDYFEIEMRNMYKTISKPQNDSHFEMLKKYGKDRMTKDNVFCEIGFGAGLTLKYVSGYFKNLYGLDISKKNIDYTINEFKKEGYNNIEFHFSDLMKFDQMFENKFDVISFIHGLEHFSSEDYSVIFGNIRKYLKPGGIFTGALPNKNEYNFRMCPKCNYVFEIDGHVSSHDISSLEKVFKENRFGIIYLNDFNMQYCMKDGSSLQKLHRLILYKLFNRKFFSQLEFIVKPE